MKLVSLAALAAFLAAPVYAVTVSDTKTHTALGQDLTYTFTGLAPSNGTGGTLTLTGVNLDLGADANEYMSITVDGASYGSYVCDATPSAGRTNISGWTGPNESRCSFTLSFALTAGALDTILADGTMTVFADMGPGVYQPSQPTPSLSVMLSYAEYVTPTTPVPLPASALLMVGGAVGLAGLRRTRR